MEEAFAAYLAGDATLMAAVSNRMDWAKLPQGQETPAIALWVISDIPTYSDEGDAGLTAARIQIDSWALTYALAKDVSRKVMSRLNQNGNQFTQSQIEFQLAFKEDEQDSFEVGNAGDELYRVRQDIIVMYKGV